MHLLGRRPMDTMPEFFALSDCLLSTLKKEPVFAWTVPSKVQSYLACAKPVIVAMEGEGARTIMEANAGFACPPEDPESLARAVLNMSALSESERAEMGSSGKKYFDDHFELNNLANRLEGWMDKLKK